MFLCFVSLTSFLSLHHAALSFSQLKADIECGALDSKHGINHNTNSKRRILAFCSNMLRIRVIQSSTVLFKMHIDFRGDQCCNMSEYITLYPAAPLQKPVGSSG